MKTPRPTNADLAEKFLTASCLEFWPRDKYDPPRWIEPVGAPDEQRYKEVGADLVRARVFAWLCRSFPTERALVTPTRVNAIEKLARLASMTARKDEGGAA